MALAGIEPATFQFVAQHLNHCATAVPNPYSVLDLIYLDVLYCLMLAFRNFRNL